MIRLLRKHNIIGEFIMSEIMYKVALVGCGVISKNHLAALKTVPNVKVVALCDIKPERAENRKSEFGLDCSIYTDFDKMLKEVDFNCLHVTTPHYLHASMTIKALKKDINVFLEKPMCTSRQEIKDMLEAEKNSKGKVCVCFQNRFNPSTLKAKEIVAEDGGAISAYGSVFWDRDVPYYVNSGWRGFYSTEGGGVMINQAIHTLDLVCQFLGTPKKIWATKANHHLKGVIEVEDSCEGMIEFDSGKYGNFYATTAFHGYSSTHLFVLTKNHRIEIRDSKLLYVDDQLIDEATDKSFIGKAVYGNGHQYLINKFYKALNENSDMPVSMESAQYAVRLLLSAYESQDNETNI